jgi:TolB-like protein/Flp pilus assembly protein TadD
MHDAAHGTRILRFGLYEVDLRSGELRKDGIRIRLQEQPLQVLSLLLRQPGEIVTRDEIQREIWGGDTFVDFDHGLNKAISKLREALNDSPTAPRFIETIARRGYRFLAPVSTAQIPTGNGRPVIKRQRIAILPFQNLSGDPNQEFFSDGLTEEMIIQVGQLQPSQLSVIARTSVMPYKGSTKGVATIGNELQADYLLEGSVRRFHDRVRISAQLIQVSDAGCLWSETYERELADVFTIQLEVARKIGASLAFELLPEQRPEPIAPPTSSATAHEAYLHGRFLWNRRTEDSVLEAMRQFREALKIDQGYALAHAGLANCYGMLGWYGAISPKEAGEKATAEVHRALQIDPRLAEAQCSLALLKFWFEWDWPGADVAFRRSIERSPNYATAHHWYGAYLNAMRRFDEAECACRRASELDPMSIAVEKASADTYLYRREYKEAISRLRTIIDREPRFFSAHFDLGRAYLFAGKYADAISSLETAIELSGNLAGTAALGCALARAGRKVEATAILEDLKNPVSQRGVSPAGVATILLALGDHEEAFEYLEKAFESRCFWLVYLEVDPSFDSIRTEPRFCSLLKRMGFRHGGGDAIAQQQALA